MSDRAEYADAITRIEELEAEVSDLRDALESQSDSTDAMLKHVIQPRLDDLEEASDDAREERAELGAKLAEANHQIAQQQSRLEIQAGVADDSESNPAKRVADLRDAMIERADARGDSGSYYRIKLWWQDVQDLFADRGHGTVAKPDCYKAMEDAAEAPGFEMATKTNEAGRDVKAVAVDTEALREEIGSRNPTTPEGVTAGDFGGESAANATQD